jgi:uncharacterized membrane protein
MSTPASIAKHPIHPMLIVFPIGLWVFSFVADLVWLLGGAAVWQDLAFYTMAGGVVGALMAAVPGIADFLSITDPQVRMVGWAHMLINLSVVALYAVNLWLRTWTPPLALLPVVLSGIAVVLLAISGWLGGELVYVHGMGVEAPRPAEAPRDRRAA